MSYGDGTTTRAPSYYAIEYRRANCNAYVIVYRGSVAIRRGAKDILQHRRLHVTREVLDLKDRDDGWNNSDC